MAMPELGSAAGRIVRRKVAAVWIAFGVIWVSLLGWMFVQAVMASSFYALAGVLAAGAWLAFMSWVVLTWAFAGHFPRAFCHFFSGLWGWPVIPYPPPRQARHEARNPNQ